MRYFKTIRPRSWQLIRWNVRDLFKRYLHLFLIFLIEPHLWARSETLPNSPLLQQKISEALERKLDESREWQKLLFIPDRWYPSQTSLIDDSEFFLAEDGKSSPKSELLASLVAFYEKKTVQIKDELKEAQCVWAARFRFLDRELGLIQDGFPQVSCPDLDKFLSYAQYDGISLVFSNYFLNNPSSMFGHSFIRLHRKKTTRSPFKADLLDDAVNFSAFIGDSAINPLYPIKGMLGFYQGRFAMLPYYSKIQEYNNSESRDIWEFRLNFSPEELEKLVLVLWEQGGFYMDYYFLDDNCAYVLLMLLEAARPEMSFTSELPLYAIPSDAIRVAVDKGIVGQVNHRHSVASRMLSRYEELNESQRQLVNEWQKNQLAPEFLEKTDCTGECMVKVLDTVIELVDYQKAFASDDAQVTRLASLRPELLLRRSKTKIVSRSVAYPPISSRIDQGHRSAYISFGAGFSSKQDTIGRFRWKPALHDLASPVTGYGDGMAIGFLDTQFGFEKEEVRVEHLHLLQITSLPDQHPLVAPMSWAFDLVYENPLACNQEDNPNCRRIATKLAGGMNWSFWRSRGRVYSLIGGVAALSENSRGLLSPLVMQGLILRPNSKVTMEQQFQAELDIPRGSQLRYRGLFQILYYPDVNYDIRLAAEIEDDQDRYLLGSGYYF